MRSLLASSVDRSNFIRCREDDEYFEAVSPTFYESTENFDEIYQPRCVLRDVQDYRSALILIPIIQ